MYFLAHIPSEFTGEAIIINQWQGSKPPQILQNEFPEMILGGLVGLYVLGHGSDI